MTTLLHPSYFPNIATYSVLVQNPVIWEVWDNYQKQTYRNRCYVATDQGRHMLTVPIKHTGGKHGRQLFRDVRIDNSYSWQRLHWRGLQTAYRASPYFEFFEEDLQSIFSNRYTFLLDLNFSTIEAIGECLQITVPTERTGKYHLNVSGMIDGRSLVNAKEEIKLDQRTYVQVFHQRHGFLANLSVLDLLFNEGPGALNYLEEIKINLNSD